MVSLSATQIGQAVDLVRLNGKIHSVFDRACNLALEGGGFATLINCDVALAPRAIRLATPTGFRFVELLVHGVRFACRGGVLRFAGADFSVDVRTAKSAECTLPSVSDRDFDADARIRWDAAWGALFEFEPLYRIACPGAIGLLNDIERRTTATTLIGVGPGLTPAGDDVLVGFAAGAAMAGRDICDVVPAIAAAASRTTDLSASMLRDAMAGLFSEPVIALASAIRLGGDVRDALERLGEVGDTSGVAAALGVLIGLAAGDAALRDVACGRLRAVTSVPREAA